MMTMDRTPPERASQAGRSDCWTSSCTTVGGFRVRDCVEIARQNSDVHVAVEDVNCIQTCIQSAAIPKRTVSIASSTADENTDCDSREMMEARRQKREKANQNERKRSQGINDCLKQQEARLKQHTDLDTGKLGKKGIMQEFTKCFDQYTKYCKFSPDVLDLANALVQSGYTVQSLGTAATAAATASLQSGGNQRTAPSMPVSVPGYPMLLPNVPMTPTATPRYSANVNQESQPPPQQQQQLQQQLQQQQQQQQQQHSMPPVSLLPTPPPPAAFVAYSQGNVMCTAPSYSTPLQAAPCMSYYGQTPSTATPLPPQPQPLYYLPMQTPNSQMGPVSVAAGIANPAAAASFSRKRPSSDSSASGGSSSPPVKMTRRAAVGTASDGVEEPPPTPCRPAADRSSFAGCGASSDSLAFAMLATACELERQNVLRESGEGSGSERCEDDDGDDDEDDVEDISAD